MTDSRGASCSRDELQDLIGGVDRALLAELLAGAQEQPGEPDELPTKAEDGLYLDEVTMQDMIDQFPGGFMIGPNGGVYEVVRVGPYDQERGVGVVGVTPVAVDKEAIRNGGDDGE